MELLVVSPDARPAALGLPARSASGHVTDLPYGAGRLWISTLAWPLGATGISWRQRSSDGLVLHCLHAAGGQGALDAAGQEPPGRIIPAQDGVQVGQR